MARRQVEGLIALVVTGALLAWGAWRVLEDRRFQRDLEQAVSEIAVGRFGHARDRLSGLSARRPGQADVEYRLGLCEQRLGHSDGALAAWARVAPGTPFTAWAAVARAVTLIEQRG